MIVLACRMRLCLQLIEPIGGADSDLVHGEVIPSIDLQVQSGFPGLPLLSPDSDRGCTRLQRASRGQPGAVQIMLTMIPGIKKPRQGTPDGALVFQGCAFTSELGPGQGLWSGPFACRCLLPFGFGCRLGLDGRKELFYNLFQHILFNIQHNTWGSGICMRKDVK